MITQLTEHQARQLLGSARVGRLGCIVDGEPYITPINYKFEGDSIYSHSLRGRKIEGLRKNPRACIQVDRVKSDLYWQSVLAFGAYEEVVDRAERESILRSLLKEFPMLTPVESALIEDGYTPEVIIFRIRIDRITGVSEGVASDEFLLIEDAGNGSISVG
jgi:nitroimidazol reductase NimA-like FMN-containing flavoprotein (pyridoxamine 5'-phosphate oxidase superfamily)